MGWFYRNILEPGKLPLLLALASFVLTFVVTRAITRMIRAGRGPFRNVVSGGVHIHHVVPGVLLTVAGGFGAVAAFESDVGLAVSAVVFGIGAGLLLDEFALILHLDDVYWSDQGRQSVETVVMTVALVLLLLCGFAPFGVNDMTAEEQTDRRLVIVVLLLNFCFAVVTLFKGKLRMGLIGCLVPLVAVFGAVRLARPGSPWARRLYARRPKARARARLRAYRHDRRWAGPRRRFQDLIGGFQEKVSAQDRDPRSGPGTGR
ncbi:hypothetical protein GCM10020367_17650 [Streptomyces sannanensis]|uniref:Integral membrane protein n=1 Tax=Streptomyces sannanensis TaxID=285536 RepID=A0ABP6S8M6_9ACTN